MASLRISCARTSLTGALLLAVAALAGCAQRAPEPADTVHVADIINSVKCGLAQALVSDAGHRRLAGTVASVQLGLKVADTRSAGFNSPSVTGPVVVAWLGPLVLPTLNASVSEYATIDTTIDLTYRLDAPNVSVCNAPGVNPQDKLGFARWLGDVIAGLAKVTPQGPKGTLDRLTYDATFGVTRDGSAGGSVNVVFLSASLTAGASRSDTQHLRVVISGANGIAASAAAPVAVAVPAARSVGHIPNLSSSGPAQR